MDNFRYVDYTTLTIKLHMNPLGHHYYGPWSYWPEQGRRKRLKSKPLYSQIYNRHSNILTLVIASYLVTDGSIFHLLTRRYFIVLTSPKYSLENINSMLKHFESLIQNSFLQNIGCTLSGFRILWSIIIQQTVSYSTWRTIGYR